MSRMEVVVIKVSVDQQPLLALWQRWLQRQLTIISIPGIPWQLSLSPLWATVAFRSPQSFDQLIMSHCPCCHLPSAISSSLWLSSALHHFFLKEYPRFFFPALWVNLSIRWWKYTILQTQKRKNRSKKRPGQVLEYGCIFKFWFYIGDFIWQNRPKLLSCDFSCICISAAIRQRTGLCLLNIFFRCLP